MIIFKRSDTGELATFIDSTLASKTNNHKENVNNTSTPKLHRPAYHNYNDWLDNYYDFLDKYIDDLWECLYLNIVYFKEG